jgi:hypothetical protein
MFGVDTASSLASINWSNFYSWKGIYPRFAGRYFAGGFNWVSGEGTSAKQSTGGALGLILPIQASLPPIPTHQATTGSAGFNYGVADADQTCANVNVVINSGELALPPGGTVAIYLDVESTTVLTADYWAGWSNTVYNYKLGTGAPYWASMYCSYAQPQGGGLYYPNSYIQAALDAAYSSYPSYYTLCHSLWSSEPEPAPNCESDPCLDWTQFGEYLQPQASGSVLVPLQVWQFAKNNVCAGYGYTDFAGGQNLDVDDTGNWDGPLYMLVIT